MSRYLSHLAALTLHQVEPVQPRLASRFETPVDRGAAGHTDLDVAQETQVSMPHEPVQPSVLQTPNVPVTQFVIPTAEERQAKKVINGQGQPEIILPTEFRVKQPEPFGEQQKTSSDQHTSLVDNATVISAAQPVNKPVAQGFQTDRKGTPPIENVGILVERVQEHFTETTHNELVIKEVAVPEASQKIIKPDVSMPAAPVKPVSIKPWSEESTFGANLPRQSGAQQIMAAKFDTDTTPVPTIQVTIGRIEIRATQIAQKLAEKPRAVSNTLSLDDYLKQRNGGKS